MSAATSLSAVLRVHGSAQDVRRDDVRSHLQGRGRWRREDSGAHGVRALRRRVREVRCVRRDLRAREVHRGVLPAPAGLHDGFLGAKNNGKMQFFLMWANHDFTDGCNNKVSRKDDRVRLRGGRARRRPHHGVQLECDPPRRHRDAWRRVRHHVHICAPHQAARRTGATATRPRAIRN